MKKGNLQHEDVLTQVIEELEQDGYRVIRLEAKSPDAIAVKGTRVLAVEVLGSTHRSGKGWHKGWSHRKKRIIYHMFDDLIIRVFRRDTKYQPGGPTYLEEEVEHDS